MHSIIAIFRLDLILVKNIRLKRSEDLVYSVTYLCSCEKNICCFYT